MEREYVKEHAVRVALATIGSIVVLSDLVKILPFG
jgi:hypothetical protein